MYLPTPGFSLSDRHRKPGPFHYTSPKHLPRAVNASSRRAGGGKKSACRQSSATATLGARGREAGSETCVSVPYTWDPAGKKQVPKRAFLSHRLQAHGWLVARVVMARVGTARVGMARVVIARVGMARVVMALVGMARVGVASDGSGSDGSGGDGSGGDG